MLSDIQPKSWQVEAAKGLAESFVNDRKAQTQGAMVAVSLVVALVVASLVAAFLLPIGIDEIIAVDTASWSDGATAMWDILDVLIVLSLFLFFVAIALSAANRV